MTNLERKIYEWRPVTFLLRKSKKTVLPGFQGMPLYDVMKFFFNQITKIGFTERAASISFNILVALPAGLIFLCTLVPYLPTAIDFQNQLLSTLRDVLRNEKTYQLAAGIINDFFTTTRGDLLSVSFLTGIFFSSNAMMGIMTTFDNSYFEVGRGKFLAKRWMAIKLTALLVLLIIVSMLLLATQGPLKTLFLRRLGWDNFITRTIFEYSRWVIILLITYFTIAFIYRWGPAMVVKWKILSPGAILATALTILTTLLFSIWVNNFASYNKVYGSIGTVLILMNLIYINSLVLLIGFEVNASIAAIKAENQKRVKEKED
jgi:membrane protein